MDRAAASTRQPTDGATAVLDACVLVPFTLRGVLLGAAERGAFAPLWSEPILGEVKGVLLGKGIIDTPRWQHLDRTLRRAFPDALVPSSAVRRLEPAMTNDRKDRHVVAAAVAARSPVIVTNNLKDFRSTDLEPVGVRAIHPDSYLVALLDRAPELMRDVLSGHVSDMAERSRWTEGQVLGHLGGLGRGAAIAPRFAARAETALGIRAVAPHVRDAPRTGLSRGARRTSPSRGLSGHGPARGGLSI